MNKVIFDTYAKDNEIQIIPLADLHYGSEMCDEEYIKAVIDYIEQTPNCYFILNGDLIENALPKSPSSFTGNSVSIQTQIALMTNWLSKIVKQKKCINITIGNHEERSNKEVGLNPMDMIVANLCQFDETLNERYLPFGAYSFIIVHTSSKNTAGQHTSLITMYNLHGTSGGIKYGSAVNKLHELGDIIPANIYIRSHTHKPETHTGKMFVIDKQHRDITEEKCVYASNGAFLRYGGYAQKKQYQLVDNSTPIITIKIVRKRYTENHKEREFSEKQIECVLRNKEWFMEQVRKK